jgi:peptide subunit release factor 1 (eRF1)
VHGLAAVGGKASLYALRRGQADVLLMAREYAPGIQWLCGRCGASATTCGASSTTPGARPECPECGSNDIRQTALKEELIRLAEQNGAEIETVGQSDFLMEMGGVGCLLRYR